MYAEIREAEAALDLDHLAPAARDAPDRRVHLQLLREARGVRAPGGGREPGARRPLPQVEGDAHAQPPDHRPAGARDRARAGRRPASAAESTRSRSTRRSPRSACSTSPTSTRSAAFSSARWARKAMSRRRRELVADMILGYLTHDCARNIKQEDSMRLDLTDRRAALARRCHRRAAAALPGRGAGQAQRSASRRCSPTRTSAPT